ncbi:MAG: DUF948 domain-containing protein [Atopobiaceae bacterium]
MDVLHIALIILVAVGIWAVCELALTIRKTRDSVEQVTRSANEAIEQVQPIIAKADGMVDELQPSVKNIQPLLDKAGTAVDVATVDLATLNDILTDVSDVSGAASNVTNTVSRVADSAANGVAQAVGKLTGRPVHPKQQLTESSQASGQHDADQKADAPEAAHMAHEADTTQADDDSYVTYGSANSDVVDGE